MRIILAIFLVALAAPVNAEGYSSFQHCDRHNCVTTTYGPDGSVSRHWSSPRRNNQ